MGFESHLRGDFPVTISRGLPPRATKSARLEGCRVRKENIRFIESPPTVGLPESAVPICKSLAVLPIIPP
jgi:hypothetical protein